MKPNKEAVSLVITDDNGNFLAVKRADDPTDDLANVWGFPAVSLKEGESHQQAALRVGRQKLGVDIELGEKIGDSTHDRGSYILHLTDYKAKITKGCQLRHKAIYLLASMLNVHIQMIQPYFLKPPAKVHNARNSTLNLSAPIGENS